MSARAGAAPSPRRRAAAARTSLLGGGGVGPLEGGPVRLGPGPEDALEDLLEALLLPLPALLEAGLLLLLLLLLGLPLLLLRLRGRLPRLVLLLEDGDVGLEVLLEEVLRLGGLRPRPEEAEEGPALDPGVLDLGDVGEVGEEELARGREPPLLLDLPEHLPVPLVGLELDLPPLRARAREDVADPEAQPDWHPPAQARVLVGEPEVRHLVVHAPERAPPPVPVLERRDLEGSHERHVHRVALEGVVLLPVLADPQDRGARHPVADPGAVLPEPADQRLGLVQDAGRVTVVRVGEGVEVPRVLVGPSLREPRLRGLPRLLEEGRPLQGALGGVALPDLEERVEVEVLVLGASGHRAFSRDELEALQTPPEVGGELLPPVLEDLEVHRPLRILPLEHPRHRPAGDGELLELDLIAGRRDPVDRRLLLLVEEVPAVGVLLEVGLVVDVVALEPDGDRRPVLLLLHLRPAVLGDLGGEEDDPHLGRVDGSPFLLRLVLAVRDVLGDHPPLARRERDRLPVLRDLDLEAELLVLVESPGRLRRGNRRDQRGQRDR